MHTAKPNPYWKVDDLGKAYTRNSDGATFFMRVYERQQLVHRQEKPFNKPLPYDNQVSTVINRQSAQSKIWVPADISSCGDPLQAQYKARAYGKAYDNFVGNWKNGAQGWGETAGEHIGRHKPKMDEAASHLGAWARDAYRHNSASTGNRGYVPPWAKKKIKIFMEDGGYTYSFRDQELPAMKNMSKVWLSSKLFWIPLIQDIFNAAEMMSLPYYDFEKKCTGTGREYFHSSSRVTTQQYGCTIVDGHLTEGYVFAKIGARVRVTNPNAFVWNQLGIANPAKVAWDLVPYSFVVDWFTNIGSYLDSYTDFMGLSLVDEYTTFHGLIRNDVNVQCTHAPKGSFIGEGSLNDYYTHSHRTLRTTGSISQPELYLKIRGLSPSHAATGIALLMQFL